MSPAMAEIPSREMLADLVRKAKAGDETARTDLFRGTVAMVYRLLSRFVGRGPDIDDLVQVTYVECFRSLASFRGESAFTTWLGSICVRVALAHRKREHRRSRDLSHLTLVAGAGDDEPEHRALERERARAVEALLGELTPTLRIPFVLHVIEAFDIKTVAAMSRLSVAATYKNVQRARAQIERAARRNPVLATYVQPSGGGA